LSVSTGSCRRGLPVINGFKLRVIVDFLLQLAQLTTVFNRASELHATLVFLLTAGFYNAVAFFVRPGHFESPNASTGVSRWTQGVTV
jgi:hypothetical protein